MPSVLDDYVAEIAHHYGRSGNAARAVEFLERAAIQSARRAAYVEAVDRLTEALALLRTLPVTPETARREFTIQSSLGQYLIPFKGVAADEVRVAFERASELARDYATKDELFWIVYGLQFHYLVRLELATAREIGERQVRDRRAVGRSRDAHGSLCRPRADAAADGRTRGGSRPCRTRTRVAARIYPIFRSVISVMPA